MKILFVCYTYFGNVGGMEIVAKRIVETIRSKHKVQVLIPNQEGFFDSGNVIKLETKDNNYMYMPKLKEFLEKNQFDLYITMGFGKYYFDYIGEWCKNNKKYSISIPIGYFHTKSNKLLKIIYGNFIGKKSLNNYNKIITATKYEKEFWIKKYKIKKEKIVVIPHTLDKNFTKFKKTGITKNLKKYLLYLGRFAPNKRVDLLIKSYNQMNLKENLVIAGNNTNNNYLKSLADKNKNPKKIIFLGKVSEDSKKELIKNCEICIFPTDYETYGLVIIEAISFKKKIIGSDIPPFREILKNKNLLFKNEEKSISNCILNNIKRKKIIKLKDKGFEYKYLQLIENLSKTHQKKSKKIQ